MSVCANCGTPLPSESADCPNCATQVLTSGATAHDVPQISGYDVLRRVGEGGMGSVYLAQERALNRRVAVKLISGKLATDSESRARFLREARSMATIEHANVIRVYAFGEVESMPYLAMEFIDGNTLADRIRLAGRLEIEDAVRLMRQILLALEAAWEKGIVHRDIKPSNILIDRRDQVHVADFGLAKPASLGDDPVLTQSGHILGTPYYLSPEQAQGLPTDFRSDIYSCGILFYEMLTGERPFEGTTPFAIVAKQLHEPLPPIRQKRADVPGRVAKMIDVMTEKRPERRPQSYAELIGQFDALLGITPSTPRIIATQTMATTAPISLDSKNVRWIAIGAAILLTALVAAWAIISTSKKNAVREARAKVDQRLAVAIAPFYGPDPDSAKEGRVMAALIERSIAEKLGPANVRIAGVDQTKDPLRSHDDARALGQKLGASVVVWGDAFALRNETEIQPYFTFLPRKKEAAKKEDLMTARNVSPVEDRGRESDTATLMNLAERRSEAVKVQAEAPNQIEMRKTSADGVGEMVSFLAAVEAFYGRNDTKLALTLLDQAPRTADTLRLRGRIMKDIGHTADKDFKGVIPPDAVKAWTEAAGDFEQALRFDPADAQTHADLADTYFLLGRTAPAWSEYAAAAATGKPYVTHYAIAYGGQLYVREAFRSELNGTGRLDDTGYLLAMDPQAEVFVRRWRMPGIIRSFKPLPSGFEIGYVYKLDSADMRTERFVDGRFQPPLVIGPNLLLRMRGMKSGQVLSQNFTREFSGLIESQPPRPRMKLATETYPYLPMTLPALETALREAARRDPTQPWHLFYLGQTLWEEGRKPEAEAVWQEMMTKDFGVIWADWNWMAKTSQRLGQREWSYRFFDRALAERRKLAQPIQFSTLIERLVNAPVTRMHPEQRKDVELAYSWLTRTRQITGLTEADNYFAHAWARYFREIGDAARARVESDVEKRSNNDPFNPQARFPRLDYLLGVLVVTWSTFVFVSVILYLRAGRRVITAATPYERKMQRRFVAVVAVLFCGAVGGLAGFGAVDIKGPAVYTFMVLALIVLAAAMSIPRITAIVRTIAAMRFVERIVIGAAFVGFAIAAPLFMHGLNVTMNLAYMPIGIADSLGHPMIVEEIERRVERYKTPALIYVAAVANQLGGNLERAKALYSMLPNDQRAARAIAALARGESFLAFPEQSEIADAYSQPASWFVVRADPTESLPSYMHAWPLAAYTTFVVGVLLLILFVIQRPVAGEEREGEVSSRFVRWLRGFTFTVVPGTYDLYAGSVARGFIGFVLFAGSAFAVWKAAGVAKVAYVTSKSQWFEWVLYEFRLNFQSPLPPHVTWVDMVLAPPYAVAFWVVALCSVVAVTVLHVTRLPKIRAAVRVPRESTPLNLSGATA